MVMKSVCVLASLLCVNAVVVNNQGDHPITKVINMLEGLKQKSIAEGKAEGVAFNKFEYWCQESTTTLKDAIAEEKEKIAELEDLIAGKTKEKEVLETEIDTVTGQLADMAASAKQAKDDRADEHKLYNKVSSDLKKTIQAVNDAMAALKGAEKSTEGLVQMRVKKVISLISLYASTTEAQMSTLQAFANGRPEQLAKGDLGKHVDTYDFKSESVIQLLKDLKAKFHDDKLTATKEETNALNAYNLAKGARDGAIAAAEKSKKQKTNTLAAVDKTLAESDKALKSEEADKKADSKSLADTDESCATKKGEWEDRSAVRTNEIAAMDQAKVILADASGIRTEAPGNPIPPASPVAFVQIDSDSSPKMSAVAVIRKAAQATHSKALERFAVEVQAHLAGPFDQMNNMIEKMIFRLMDEQKQEDEHKHWCDQEIEKTNVMIDDKEDKIANLRAEIKVENAAVSKLTEEIKDADKMIADIVAFKAEATEIREVGKKENKLAVDDAETGQKALASAIAVLTDFYKSSGEVKKEAWEAFVQKPQKLPKNPATWDAGYTGVADPDKQPGGIITVLETVMEDFAKMEAETKAQEAADSKEYDQAMSDNDIESARRTTESEMKNDEKKRRAGKIADLTRNKKDTNSELEKTEQYMSDLQPACVSGDSSYEDRKGARTQEIDALKKAQGILLDAFKEKPATTDQAAAFLHIKRH